MATSASATAAATAFQSAGALILAHSMDRTTQAIIMTPRIQGPPNQTASKANGASTRAEAARRPMSRTLNAIS